MPCNPESRKNLINRENRGFVWRDGLASIRIPTLPLHVRSQTDDRRSWSVPKNPDHRCLVGHTNLPDPVPCRAPWFPLGSNRIVKELSKENPLSLYYR
jgi:hypothetical protein